MANNRKSYCTQYANFYELHSSSSSSSSKQLHSFKVSLAQKYKIETHGEPHIPFLFSCSAPCGPGFASY
ncbi:hypothetical protein T4C_12005 [Trichinella pseudospiralis]|uniref:Uncharacterized protein n=1 Tax=Trichinella pseudospiralis TaxID=6337 RepID=A0A0V1JWV4_TRIPS|nr:hypothetical protein T4C_12005 [Trichinella pseudospiralis]